MRTSIRSKKVLSYSPDSGNRVEFEKLIKIWIEEEKLPISERDIFKFINRYDFCSPRGGVLLRTKQEWINLICKQSGVHRISRKVKQYSLEN